MSAAIIEELPLRVDPLGRAYINIEGVIPGVHNKEKLVGETAFYRYMAVYEKLIAYIKTQLSGSKFRILFAPCSIGAEPYTFAMLATSEGLFENYDLQISALDLSPQFIAFARAAQYPSSMIFSDNPTHKGYDTYRRLRKVSVIGEFCKLTDSRDADLLVQLTETITSRVKVLDAQDLLSYTPDEPYDFTVTMNLLMHLTEEARERVMDKLCAMTRIGICFNVENRLDMTEERQLMCLREPFLEHGFARTQGAFEPTKQGTSWDGNDWHDIGRSLFCETCIALARQHPEKYPGLRV